ncbi:hypothetical protein ACORG1_05875 [Mycobacterium sp. TJFP1]|jgi:hypothetical protein|uniref:hypothetical protein n=1 Tax=Mycolicibacterium vanbaalenii TaxID=110539 RepID=UPI001F31940C|nr:hypothetical protein [Mycolicibacterium vanbaalenii]UJL30985.1 hypothetical protein HZU38_11560 [Mycolicibacterium vanbaalenii]WND57811.1 hypothetical protein QQA43_05175 [Mycolicibacterium vanbaalenii]
MREPLSVCRDGLAAASASLGEHAGEVENVSTDVAADDKASTAGAADVGAAIRRFSAAYAGRLRSHARSLEQAGANYTAVDEFAATDIDSVVP